MKKTSGATQGVKYVTKNKKATYLYHITDRYEAGIALQGTEVKSVRQGNVSMADAYCKVTGNELFLLNMNIAPYEKGGYCNHAPARKRRLLMHRREILRLRSKLVQRGYTLIPLSLYFTRGLAKLSLGLAKGKHKADKRQSLKQKEAKREIRRYRY